MDIEPQSKKEKGYFIRLANGQGWHIIGSERICPWVGKLASIMGLEEYKSNGYPKLIFVPREPGKEAYRVACQGKLPKQGWSARNLRAIKLWSHQDVPDVICEIGSGSDHDLNILSMVLSLDPIYQRVQDSGGLPFHAALIERAGIGILLAAPADTGKSTCCLRIPPPWRVLCDDEALVVRNDYKKYSAHPFPTWSDYLWRRSERTWNVQNHVPLKALFFLEQAEIDEVVSIGQSQAAVYSNNSAMQVSHRTWRHMDRMEVMDIRKKLFENACQLAKAIPAFILRARISGRFWEEMEKVLLWEMEKVPL